MSIQWSIAFPKSLRSNQKEHKLCWAKTLLRGHQKSLPIRISLLPLRCPQWAHLPPLLFLCLFLHPPVSHSLIPLLLRRERPSLIHPSVLRERTGQELLVSAAHVCCSQSHLKSSRDFYPTNLKCFSVRRKKNCCCISNPCDWDLTTTQLTGYPCGSNPNPANLWRGLSPNNCAGPCSTTSMKNWERGVYCDSWEHSLSFETAVNTTSIALIDLCKTFSMERLPEPLHAASLNISSIVGSLWAHCLDDYWFRKVLWR